MAIYTIIDNRDIDNQNQSWLSSVVSLSSFYQNLSGIISGDYLDDTILKRMEWMDLSSLTKISSDLSVLLKDEHLSSMVTLSADLDEKLRTIHLNKMTQVDSDVLSKIENYLAEHGYVPGGGGGGSGSITYKYWRGITIPPHPGSGSKLISDATVTLQNDTFVYTGSRIYPVISSVKYQNENLVENTDYTVSMTAHKDVGTYYITITGMGNYSGIKSVGYQITAAPMSRTTVTLDSDSFTFNGSNIRPTVTVKDGNTTLQEGTYYDITWEDSVNVGTYQLTVVGKMDYSGYKTMSYTINQKSITAYSSLAHTEQERYKYTGNEVKPEVYWRSGTPSTFRKGFEYDVEYKNNVNVGSATITISGRGNYKDSFDISFTIYEEDVSYLDLASATITLSPQQYTYSGNQCKPTVTVVDNKGTALTKDQHYSVSYGTNVNAGTGIVYISGISPYHTGSLASVTKEFTINPATISYKASDGTGNAITGGQISISNVSPTDATVEYSLDNSSWSTTNPTITGVASSTGITVYFKISKTNYTTATGEKKVTLTTVNASDLTCSLSPSSYSVYNDSASITLDGTQKPTVVVKYGDTVLTPGVHYTNPLYSNNTGTLTAVNGTGTKTATVSMSGNGSYVSGDITKDYRITYYRRNFQPILEVRLYNSTSRKYEKVHAPDYGYSRWKVDGYSFDGTSQTVYDDGTIFFFGWDSGSQPASWMAQNKEYIKSAKDLSTVTIYFASNIYTYTVDGWSDDETSTTPQYTTSSDTHSVTKNITPNTQTQQTHAVVFIRQKS